MNRWLRPAYPVRGEINNIKDAENGSRVLQVLVTEVLHRVHEEVKRLTRSTPVNVMVVSWKNRRCDVRREVFLWQCATRETAALRDGRQCTDAAAARGGGSGWAPCRGDCRRAADPGETTRHWPESSSSPSSLPPPPRARSLPGVKVCYGRPPSRAVTSVRRRQRAHLHSHTRAQNIITNIRVRVRACRRRAMCNR